MTLKIRGGRGIPQAIQPFNHSVLLARNELSSRFGYCGRPIRPSANQQAAAYDDGVWVDRAPLHGYQNQRSQRRDY